MSLRTPYKTLTKAEAGRQPDAKYDRQRFDNYTAWLDLQVRARQEANKVFRGETPNSDLYGFSNPTTAVTTPRSEPFVVQEPSFTSGDIVRRRYDKQDSVTSQAMDLKVVRTDPWHYPNSQAVREVEHFDDYRSGSCSENSAKNRPTDKERAAAVSDSLVKKFVFAASGAKAAHVDPASAAVLFKKDIEIRPRPESLKTLNVDLSCARMPKAVAVELEAAYNKLSPVSSSGISGGREWGWCMDPQKPAQAPAPPSRDEEAEKFELNQSSLFGRSSRPARGSRSLTNFGDSSGRAPGSAPGDDRAAGPGFRKYPGTPISSPWYWQGLGVSSDAALDSWRASNKDRDENAAPGGALVPQGGKSAKQGFAGTWAVDQGKGPGLGQFHIVKPAKNPFLGGL